MVTSIRVGIINNMPDAALRSTERQFGEIIAAAGHDISLRVVWFSLLPTEKRRHYQPIENLWRLDHLDGLIVTGTEPRAQSLAEEPYWAVLAKTVDWACEHVSSVFWSCLAAHAAVLHLDGIERCPRPTKLFGTFASTKVAEHFLLAELPTDIWCAPHSRWNDLPEAALMACGYQVIARSPGAGVDMFIKHVSRSLFVFMQSHLEYDARALMREYRRDVLRYLTGERDLYPELPEGYFDPATEWELELLREDAMRTRTPDIMPIMQQAIGRANLTGAWRPKAIQFYRNWLAALGAVSPSLALSA